MRAEKESIKDLMYAPKVIKVTTIIYEEYDRIFGNKEERAKLRRNSYKEFKKTGFKKHNHSE